MKKNILFQFVILFSWTKTISLKYPVLSKQPFPLPYTIQLHSDYNGIEVLLNYFLIIDELFSGQFFFVLRFKLISRPPLM